MSGKAETHVTTHTESVVPFLEDLDTRDDSPMWYCDACLCWGRSVSGRRCHNATEVHKAALSERACFTNKLADASDELLQHIGTWERCFSCGATYTWTTIMVNCCRCSGRGGEEPDDAGIPGGPGAGVRFLCRGHALEPNCMSCGTVLGIESFTIDPMAID
jgi:hypothetical protein